MYYMFIRRAVTDLFVCCLCIETPASAYAIRFQEIEYRVIVHSSYWANTKVSQHLPRISYTATERYSPLPSFRL